MKHYLSVGENVENDGSNAEYLVEFDDEKKEFAIWIRDSIKPWSDFAVPIKVEDGARVFAKTEGSIVTGKGNTDNPTH